jgi:hypothetical protein
MLPKPCSSGSRRRLLPRWRESLSKDLRGRRGWSPTSGPSWPTRGSRPAHHAISSAWHRKVLGAARTPRSVRGPDSRSRAWPAVRLGAHCGRTSMDRTGLGHR